MRKGDTVLIVHTQPMHFSGAVCLCEVVESSKDGLVLRFVRYLKRVISVAEVKENSTVYQQ